MLQRFYRRIEEKAQDHNAAPVLIVALGDSVTQGCMELDVIDHDGVWHNRLKRMLEARYRTSTFSVINAGVGGDGTGGGIARLERDVISHHPDLVIVAYGLNDSGGGRDGMQRFHNAMEMIVLRIRQYTEAEVIFLTPSFMCSRDNDLVHPQHRAAGYVESCLQIQNSGQLAAYAHAIRDMGEKLQVPVGDVYAVWQRLAESGIDVTALLCNGLNHPNSEAQRVHAEMAMQIIDPEFQPSIERDLSVV